MASTIICAKCGKQAYRTGLRQKYCSACSKQAKKDRDHKRKYKDKEQKRSVSVNYDYDAMDTQENIQICLNCPLPDCQMTSKFCRRR